MDGGEDELSIKRASADWYAHRVVERSKALVCRNLFREQSSLLSIGRFELVRTLGRGATGIVYEAVDSLGGERVALKALHRLEPTELYRLKREFRVLGEIRHPNLVELHDLWVTDDDAYFTMDLVHGCDFLSYMRAAFAENAEAESEVRLRHVLAQLCEGLEALHRRGKLHCDVKPSNVLVTASSQVVLLDFGLALDVAQVRENEGGTPGYMAPERSRDTMVPASDWYSVGVMLKEVLHLGAGSEPVPGGFSGLWELAQRLVRPDPEKRPTFAEISAVSQGAPSRTTTAVTLPDSSQFVGRGDELAALAAAFTRSTRFPVAVLVTGESGIGKSSLLNRFERTVLEPAAAFVLRGRCYERESVPYKALDCIVDELSRVLMSVPADRVPALQQDDIGALLDMFPVLGRVRWLKRSSSGWSLPHDGRELTHGISALKAIFRSLECLGPTVIVIDDLQWADEDSGQLLAEFLCDEDSPRVLLLVADRFDHIGPSPVLGAFEAQAAFSPNPIAFERVPLNRLSAEDGLSLVRLLLDGDETSTAADRIVEVGAGSPFFIAELAKSVQASPAVQSIPRLETVFESRWASLSEAERLVLKLIAAAGRPLPAEVLRHVTTTAALPAALKRLRDFRLIQTVQRGERTLYTIAHDRIARALLGSVAGAARAALHRQLASAFEFHEGPDSEALIEQYAGADLPERAAHCAREAARTAFSALAFARAEGLYARALELGKWSAAEALALHEHRGLALEHAGRGLAAAESYARAAALATDPATTASLEERAARHLMHNGRYGEGEALLRRAYRHLGLAWPESRSALAAMVAWRVLPASLRLLGPRRLPADVQHGRARAELLAEAGAALEHYDPLRAIHNALLCFDEGDRLPDPTWRARVRGARGLMRCFSMLPGRRGLEEIREARDQAESLGDLRAQRDIEWQLAFVLYLLGRPLEALEAADRGEACQKRLPLVSTERHPIMGVTGAALLMLGRLREARRRWNTFLHETRMHDNLVTVTWVHGNPSRFPLFFADEDQDRAEDVLRRQSRMHAQHPDCVALAWARAACHVEHALYFAGSSAVSRRATLEGSLLGSGYGILDDESRYIRARARLAAASRLTPSHEKSRLLRAALSDVAARRRRSSLARALGRLLEAGVLVQRGRLDGALDRLNAALPVFVAADALLVAECAKYCKGVLIGGEGGRELVQSALSAISEEGVKNPKRWVAYVASGFGDMVEGK